MSVKFLLHTCCAPCSIAIIDELKKEFAPDAPMLRSESRTCFGTSVGAGLTVFFYNPNIHPKAEYEKRKDDVIKVCKEWGIPIVDADHEEEKWHKAVKGLEQEPEGGRRCPRCFWLRLSATAEYAAKNGFDIFGTSLTMGRNKKAEVINPIGEALGRMHGVKFFSADFKKGGRQEKGRKMTAERNIYRQNYCGCVHSLKKDFTNGPCGPTNGTNN